MSRFVIKRLIQGAITILIVTSIIWMLFEALPGDPAAKFTLDPNYSSSYLAIRREFGLDEPWYVRYLIYLRNMFTFQFGTSYSSGGRPVLSILAEAVPRTLMLFGGALAVEYGLGVVVGSFIGWRRGGIAEGATIVTSLFTYNMPSFWIGIIFLSLFYLQLGWFPSGGFETIISGQPLQGFDRVRDILWHMALPMSVLVLINVAGVILLMRTSLLEVMGEDYILTAKAKGLPERIVRRRHANRNAYLPIVTSFTIAFAFSIGGAIILESIFSYFGVGYYFLRAILNQDQFLAGATLYIISLLVVFGNVIADLMYAWLDPRVRL